MCVVKKKIKKNDKKSVGCPSLITLPTTCFIALYFLLYINVIFEGQFSSTFVGRDIFHNDEVVKRS